MNTQPPTELAAVNTMLDIIGEAPVNTVEDNGVYDASRALRVLREVSLEVQSRGWSWNTDLRFPLAPEIPTPGRIRLPNNTVQFRPCDTSRLLVQRAGALWDRVNHTDLFTDIVLVDIVRFLDFTDLAAASRQYILILAGRTFANRTEGSGISGFDKADETRALVTMKNAEAETGNFNMLRDDYTTGRGIHRRFGT